MKHIPNPFIVEREHGWKGGRGIKVKRIPSICIKIKEKNIIGI